MRGRYHATRTNARRLLMPLSGPASAAPGIQVPCIALLIALAATTTLAHAQGVGDRGTLTSVRGCEVTYEVRRPTTTIPGPVVIIGHGYMRDGSYMSGWAEAIAAVGLTAITVDLCASNATEGRHTDNGADMVALRRALGVNDAIYVGVSAGGLAALYAASLDPEAARGVLLLDPVNAGGQARSAAGKVRAPVAALVAKPQVCNAWRNIDPALQTLADATTVRIANASHCDFEWPGDRFCRLACVATNSRDERERAQERIRRIGVDFVRAVAAGSDLALAQWRGDIGPD
jgi:pimeloyl-ACP methyl ester carboxylesterase